MQNIRNAQILMRRRIRMRSSYILPGEIEKFKAAVKIQRWFKIKYWIKKPRKSLGTNAIIIQKNWRGFIGRKNANSELNLLKEAAAILIQIVYKDFKERIRNKNRIVCPICLEYTSIFTSITLECNHSICNECIRGLIQHSLANAQTAIPIKCPLVSENCSGIFSYLHKDAFNLCTNVQYRKWEHWEIMKLHIPDKYIAYCPFPQCGLPYDSSSIDMNEDDPNSFRILCPDCRTMFCAKCQSIWEGNHRCIRNIDQILGANTSNETKKYIEQHCRQCPGCNSIVEKKQTPLQIEHEKNTGLSGGTEDCHHMTCSNCKTDFCWTCLKEYSGTSYYHNDCPISDCLISFNRNIPRIVRLPLPIRTIKMIVKPSYGNQSIPSQIFWFSIDGREEHPALVPNQPNDSIIFMTVNDDGIVESLIGKTGSFTFRQENKRINQIDNNSFRQSSTLLQIQNRVRNLEANNNRRGVLNNRFLPYGTNNLSQSNN